MTKDTSALGQRFLDELKAKLPADLQSHVDALAAAPQEALEFLGTGVARQSDYSRAMDRLREQDDALKAQQAALGTRETRLQDWHGKLEAWREETESRFAARETALTEEPARRPGAAPTVEGTPPVSAADLQAQIERTLAATLGSREAAYVQYVADAVKLSAGHVRHFNEDLDVLSLVKHPQVGELGVVGVYKVLHKEQLDALQARQAAEAREVLKKELREELRTETPRDLPYPVTGGGSPLDSLSVPVDQRPKGDVATAVRMYEDLVGAARA